MRYFRNAAINLIRLAAALFAVAALIAHAQENPDENGIQSIRLGGAAGGKLVIQIELKNALANPPAGFTVNAPPRIAFDFPNTENNLGKSTQEFNEGDLRSANIVQAGNRTRLVINLNQMMSYDTRIEGNNLLIYLQTPSASSKEAASRFAEAMPSEKMHSLLDVDFHRGKNGEGRIQVDLSDSDVGIDIKQQGKKLIVDFQKTTLPANLQRKLDVTDFATPVEGIDTYSDGENVRMVVEPKGSWEHSAYQTDNKFILEIKPVVDDPNRLVKGSGYSGEKLTLNFQNIAVREALYVIADFINSNNSNIPMNMLISDTVTGNLTLRLKDVPWDQALDIILQSKGLDMRKNGNVIQIAPREELAAKEKLALSASQEISELETLQTESFPLSYQTGSVVVAMLSDEKQRILSKRGSAVVDARTNTIFIKDTPTALEEARKLIKQIDVPVRQVMIEARFVEAGDEFTRNLGGKLNFSGPSTLVPRGFSSGTGTGNVNLPGYNSTGGQITLALVNALATKSLNLELTVSEVDGKTKSIASPRVVTADSTQATIEQGVEIPYQQASSSGATNVSFKKATLSLQVTPQITPDDNVNLKINVNKDTVGTVYNGVPSINTSQVTTQVLVENGGTVVIGGVYTQDQTDSINKVPLLGDIPLLGWLFKNSVKTDNKKELLVFITPKILKDALNLH
jgi:type IV pilus assembly protein PilQ